MLRLSLKSLSVIRAISLVAPISGQSFVARRLSSSSKLNAQDVDTSKLNHMYWDDDVLLPYLLSMMDEFGDEFGGDSLNFVPPNDSNLLQNEFLKQEQVRQS